MNDNNNHIKNAELSTGQNHNMIDGIINNAPLTPPVPVPYVKPLDKVREQTKRKRGRDREER